MFALLLTRDHPDSVGALALVGAYAGWAGSLDPDQLAARIASVQATIDTPVEEWADAFLDSVLAADADRDRRNTARMLLNGWRRDTTRAFLKLATLDLRPALASMDVPTVVVRGSDDRRSPRAASVDIVTRMPRARLTEIAGAHDCSGPELDAVLVEMARAAAST